MSEPPSADKAPRGVSRADPDFTWDPLLQEEPSSSQGQPSSLPGALEAAQQDSMLRPGVSYEGSAKTVAGCLGEVLSTMETQDLSRLGRTRSFRTTILTEGRRNGVGLQREALDNGRGDEKEREDERK